MGKYIVIDGMDGSGKGTQIDLLRRHYPNAVFTREPGGSEYAEEIREVLLNSRNTSQATALTHFLLFWAAREDHMEHTVMPALRAGKTVFSDRGDSSTFAFQICGDKHEKLRELFGTMRGIVFGGHQRRFPDYYVILDLPADVSRARARQGEQNHYDARDLEYYKRVRTGFYFFMKRRPSVHVLPVENLSPGEVFKLLTTFLERREVFP